MNKENTSHKETDNLQIASYADLKRQPTEHKQQFLINKVICLDCDTPMTETFWIDQIVQGSLTVHCPICKEEKFLQRFQKKVTAGTLYVKRIIIEKLVGLKEASEMLNWDTRKTATYIKREKFPTPVQELASGPVWTETQIQTFRSKPYKVKKFFDKSKGKWGVHFLDVDGNQVTETIYVINKYRADTTANELKKKYFID